MNATTQRLLQRRVQMLGNLPVMPSVLCSLGECLSANPTASNVDRIVELISYDKSLAAQCLRTANSALFGRRIPVDTIRRAVLALGIWRVRDVVYSCSLPGVFGNADQGMAPVTFWRHALGTALVSQHLAEQLGLEYAEKYYLAGLLHDIGILVNSLLFHNEFRRALLEAERSETPLHEVEHKVLGLTHCDSGRILADLWKLPQDIAETIELHHHPVDKKLASEMTCTVYLADMLCRLRGLGYGYYEARAFDLASEPAWKWLQQRHPAAGELDLARFTFELDEHAIKVQALVDSIFGNKETETASN